MPLLILRPKTKTIGERVFLPHDKLSIQRVQDRHARYNSMVSLNPDAELHQLLDIPVPSGNSPGPIARVVLR